MEKSLGHGLAPFLTFYPAVMLVALAAGVWPGLLATAVAALLAGYWLIPPVGLDFERPADAADVAFFTLMGVSMSVVAELYRRNRRKAEEQQFYTRSLIEASLDPLVTISREGKITDVNRATESVTGVARDGLIGSDFCDYFTEPEKARAGYQQVFADGSVQDYPLAIRHSSGRLTEVLYNATVFRNQKGEAEGVFAAARDVTERKRAEERSREQAALLELAPAAILVRDLESRIVYWSRSAEELYGWSKQEALGKVTHELLRAQYPQPVAEIQSSVLQGAGWEGELVHTTRYGKQITLASRWAPQYDENRQAIGFLEINVDITARKKAEQELQRYMQELERSNAELQDFASIASHDLQEPLRKVLAFGEHLKEHSGDKLDDVGRDFLARMQNAAQRMSGLIEALLQYSRVATRAQPIQAVDMLAVVFGVVADMEERIAQSHARIELVPMPKVMADPMQVRQLVQNLVGNALKFQRPGSQPHVEIEGRDHGWRALRDQRARQRDRVRGEVSRPHLPPVPAAAWAEEFEGSGMGLAICRKIVARHGGAITARSAPGEGSTFVVTLPAAMEVQVEQKERSETWARERAAS